MTRGTSSAIAFFFYEGMPPDLPVPDSLGIAIHGSSRRELGALSRRMGDSESACLSRCLGEMRTKDVSENGGRQRRRVRSSSLGLFGRSGAPIGVDRQGDPIGRAFGGRGDEEPFAVAGDLET